MRSIKVTNEFREKQTYGEWPLGQALLPGSAVPGGPNAENKNKAKQRFKFKRFTPIISTPPVGDTAFAASPKQAGGGNGGTQEPKL